jgi:hypothetical protein
MAKKPLNGIGDALDPECPEVGAFAQILIETIESAADGGEALRHSRDEFDAFEVAHQVGCARCRDYVMELSGAGASTR